MTDRQRVLSRFPTAFARKHNDAGDNLWLICDTFRGYGIQVRVLAQARSARAAWADAARMYVA